MRRVLMVCYHFPPAGGIASVRAARFVRHLPAEGWEPLVVSSNVCVLGVDASLTWGDARVSRAYRLPLSRLSGLRPASEVLAESARSPRFVNWVRSLVRSWIHIPDAEIGWVPFAVLEAMRAIRARPVQAVYSSAYPMSAHLVAWIVHRITGIPWVAEYRDLWSNWVGHRGLRQRLNVALERALVREASAVVTVSDTYAEEFRKRGARRAEVITNGYDPSDFSGGAPVPDVDLAYLGTYYPEAQDLRAVLRAMAEMAASPKGPTPRLRLIGRYPPSIAEEASRLGIEPLIEATGLIAHDEAMRSMRAARVLVFSGPVPCDGPHLVGNVAAKVFEYMASGRPVLAVAHPDADVVTLLASCPQLRVVPPDDVAGARQAIIDLLRAGPGAGATAHAPAPCNASAPSVETFSSASLTRRLAALLDDVGH